MIPISAYTEPVSVNTAVSESLQVHEHEEDNESSSFAEILAGLLGTSEKNQFIPPDDFSDTEIGVDVFTFGKIEIAEGLFAAEEDLTQEKDFSPAHLSTTNAEYLFANLTETDSIDDLNHLSEISGGKAVNRLPEAETKVDFSMSDSTEISNVSQIAAANGVNSDETERNNQKDRGSNERIFAKSENTEAASVKVTQNERKEDLRNNAENEPRGRLDEMRSRRRDGISFEVRDMRTEVNAMNNSQTTFSAAEAATRVQGESPVREISLELRLPDNSGSIAQNQTQTSWETKASSALENMLARELHQNFNGDIVRHASVALRDGGEGTIKIALKPESLGNVKIHLEMAENKITGRIIVESEEALNAFRKEIASLEKAFREFGFEGADLNLSLAGGGQSADEWEKETGFFSPRMAALRYEESYEQDALTTADILFEQKAGSINMLA